MPAPPSPARRVLADKTPNAFIRRVDGPLTKPYLDDSLFEEQRDLGNQTVEMDVDRRLSPKTGQKRSIHEVDGTEEQEQLGRDRAGLASPPTVLPTEPNSETDDRDFLSTSRTKRATSSALTSFHVSQESSVPVEDQFEIQDEMSQQTLEKIHATAIPDNASQLPPPLHPVLATETSQDSLRMSSFIDFEPDEREEESLRVIPPETPISTANGLGRATMEETADALRTRLQLALYKVQTNQVSKPFSRLEQPRCASPELPPQPPSQSRPSPEGIVAAARARATQQKKPPVRNLNSLPIPIIMPTVYSARYMHVEEEAEAPPALNDAAKGSSEGARSLDKSSTPPSRSEDRTTCPKTPMLLGSPRRSGLDSLGLKHGRGKKLVDGLTSSVVKGEAANGLLELMRAAAA